MAGDWIKMRNNLWDDPRVSRICDLTNEGEAAVVGGLYWLWASADEHTEDGYLPGLTTLGIDRKTGVKGFGAALVAVGWVADTEGGITLLKFEEHNGTSAKRRCVDAQRKATVRNVSASEADTTRTDNGQKTPDLGAREEKIREEKRKEEGETRKRVTAPARPNDVGEQVWQDWVQLRKSKRTTVSPTVIAEARTEAEKAGLTLERFLSVWCVRGSQGLMADWLKPDERSATVRPFAPVNRQEAIEQRNRAGAEAWAAQGATHATQ